VKYYPAFINLKDKKAVVVGGGIRKLAERGLLSYIKRNYRKGDLHGAFIVIAATSSEVLNTRIARDAQYLVNVVDMPSEGNYIVPSIVKRGHLTIAISTEGVSPAVSKAIRKEIERHYRNEFALYLRFVETIRKRAMKKIIDPAEREIFLQSLASHELINTLRKQGFRKTQNKVLSYLNSIE